MSSLLTGHHGRHGHHCCHGYDYHCSHARHVHHGHQDRQENQDKRADRTFKLDFPGNLCRAAFAILAMFRFCVGLHNVRKFSMIFQHKRHVCVQKVDSTATEFFSQYLKNELDYENFSACIRKLLLTFSNLHRLSRMCFSCWVICISWWWKMYFWWGERRASSRY